jgi:hypothetical protein
MPTSPSQLRSRLEFRDSESWRTYIEANVPPQDRAYVAAFGLTTLYLQFYLVRNQALPAEFTEELDRLHALQEPERTRALLALNNRIFADMTRLMMQTAPTERGITPAETPNQNVEKLIIRLEKESPEFAIWCGYKRAQLHDSGLPEWSDYVQALLPHGAAEEAEFILLMGQLGELLRQFQDQRKPLDALLKIRISAVQRERVGAERNLATRLLVHELLEAIAPCAYA